MPGGDESGLPDILVPVNGSDVVQRSNMICFD